MKTSTKLMAAVMFIAAIFFGENVMAQSTESGPLRFGIGLETGLPTGNSLGKIAGWELGGTARLQYGVSNGLDIILTSGYYNFFSGSNTNATTSFGNYTYGTKTHDLGIIPVKLGLKGFIGNGIYLSAEGGVGFETKYSEDKKLILSPGFGWADKTWDIGIRYENFSGQDNNYGLVGARIAYGFKL